MPERVLVDQTALDLKASIASPTFTGTVSGITASMVGLGNVNNISDANKPISTAALAALALKLDKTRSFMNVLDYCVGDDTVDDTTGWNTAITTAATFGAAIYAPKPPVRYKITGPITPTAGSTIFGAGRGTEIRQYTRTNKPVFDCLDVDGVTIFGFTLSLNGGPLTTPGSSFRGENGYTYASGVWSNGSRNTFRDMRIIDFAGGVMLSSWNGTTISATKRTGNRVRDLEISGANFGILFHPQDRLQIRGIECYDFYDTSSGVNPLHTIYATGNTSLRHSNVTISDCITKNLTFGAAYQTKYIDGLVMNNMIADGCQGIYNGIDINDASLTNFVSTNDTGDVGASFALQKVSVIPERISISNITITKTVDTVGQDRCVSLYGNNMTVRNLNLFPNDSAAHANYACILRGNKISLDGIKVTGIGPGKNKAVLVGFGTTFPSSDITVTDIETDNVAAVVDFEIGLTGTNVVTYNPALQRNVTAGAQWFGEPSGTTPFILSRMAHTNTYTVTGGGTYVPTPGMETVTRYNVTDATAFTIGAPLVRSKTGMAQDIAIVNGSAGALGAITWNAAYSLRNTFITPPVGESHRITFVYDGTVWRETSRSNGAGIITPVVAVTGLTGAITQARFVGGTTAGAPITGTFAVNDYVTSSDGNFYICTVAGTPGTWVAVGTPASLNALAANALTAGEVVPERDDWGSNAIGLATGALVLTHFTADKSEAITTLTAYTGATAAAATPTLIRYAAYSVATNGDLTLVASTVNDTTLLSVANTDYPKALSATWNKVVGQRYAVGLLVVSAGTMPSFHGRQMTATGPMNTMSRLAPMTVSRVLSQTDLPSTVANAGISGYQAKIAMRMS